MTTEPAIDESIFDHDEADFSFGSASLESPDSIAEAQAVVQGTSDNTTPLIGEPSDTTVRLPGGFIAKDGTVYNSAEVRELTGQDEEALARAVAANSMVRYQQVLLERGVAMLGTTPATPELLAGLCLGDRDTLMLGVRIATFGPKIEMDVRCPVVGCNVEAKILVHAREDVPMKELAAGISLTENAVTLRNGQSAVVRLPLGSDVISAAERTEATIAEQNTYMLSRCVTQIGGRPLDKGIALNTIKAMGMADRKALIDFLAEFQPGPQFGDVKYACTACGKEMTLGLGVRDLFPGA